jgi:hypothetical protein
MDDLFSAAALFLPAIDVNSSTTRAQLIQDLEKLLHNSPFLSDTQKEKMAKVIPIFTDEIIQDLKQTLIRQNLRYLQDKMIKPT